MKLADLRALPAGTPLLNKTSPVTLIGLAVNSRTTPRGRATTYARVTTPTGGEALVLPRLLTPDPYPVIVPERPGLGKHTITVERVDRDTARKWIGIVGEDWESLIGRRAVVERGTGREPKVCAIEGVEGAGGGVGIEVVAACTADAYRAVYVPATC